MSAREDELTLRRLLPEPTGPTAPEEAYTGLRLADLAPAERPWTVANMVSSLDGKATLHGRTRELSSEMDRRIFHLLRTQCDAVLVGSHTIRDEGYGRLIKNDELRALRVADGLAPDPVCVTISRGLDLAVEAPLFQDERSHVIVATASDAEPPAVPARLEILRLPATEIGPAAVLRRVRDEHGIRSVLCEGGPTMLGLLVAEGALDELFLCIAPLLIGGPSELGLLRGAVPAAPSRTTLVAAFEHESALFLRQRLTAAPA
jgi:5-amino-6-(5-phosphoribosylamino)uracil reductase